MSSNKTGARGKNVKKCPCKYVGVRVEFLRVGIGQLGWTGRRVRIEAGGEWN